MGGNFRERGFWLVDRLHGGPIRKHYDEIAYLTSHPDESARSSSARLQELLCHATTYVPHYGRFKGVTSLADLPVLQKDEIRQHYDSFSSSQYEGRTLSRVTTSGSYGTPMTFGLSPDRHSRKMAELIFYSEWAGFRVGTRHASIGSRSKRALVALMQNEVPMLARVVDDRWLDRQLERLRLDRVRAVIGHASLLGLLAGHSLHAGYAASDYSLETAIATAELLTDDVRAMVRAAFGCRALSRYAAHELGVIAHECPHCGQYHINMPSLVVELLALDDDRPVPSGALGRVVVTDLFSHAMPLIRYDTGDVATLARSPAPGCPIRTTAFARIQGRKTELVYTTAGEPVHPLTILDVIGEITHGQARQFQFVQEGRRGYSVKVVTSGVFSAAASLADRMKSMLGADADVRVCCVESIPALESGKRSCVVNNYTRRG
jgi:phenylacetate-CoA ligase